LANHSEAHCVAEKALKDGVEGSQGADFGVVRSSFEEEIAEVLQEVFPVACGWPMPKGRECVDEG
jgi:hypothetical protein